MTPYNLVTSKITNPVYSLGNLSQRIVAHRRLQALDMDIRTYLLALIPNWGCAQLCPANPADLRPPRFVAFPTSKAKAASSRSLRCWWWC